MIRYFQGRPLKLGLGLERVTEEIVLEIVHKFFQEGATSERRPPTAAARSETDDSSDLTPVHLSLPQVSCLSHIAANYLNAGKEARRWGTAHESIVPYQGFKTKDGHIVVAAGNDKQFVRVCQVLELLELTEDPNYKTNKLRVQNRKQLLHTLSHRFLQGKTADWLKRFEGSGVPVGPIHSIQEVFSDPQVKHNALIQEMNHPTAGRIAVPGPAVRFSSFAPGGPTPPPVIGQHTVQVLRDTLSYSDDVIKTLLESKAVAQNQVS
uniref:Succinate--hydroxymethylglutarate CoA-transferase-like n=1 Tax=Seriola lalandi dorsalis TaxID=1841481 RepID=A0A3B4WSB2_SERLL